MAGKAIVAGHICIDITPIFQGEKCDDISKLLRPGKLIQVGTADVHTGGAVANTGLAMKILGADVSLMGKVGTDEFGDMIRSILKKYDAADGMIVAEGESSSYSVVLAIPGIDRIFLHDPGANNTFSADDVDDESLKDCDLFHFGYPPLMAKMYVNNGAELEKLFKKVKSYGIVTSLDMAAVDPSSEAGRQDWSIILKRTLPYVDLFVPSVEELGYMIDKDRFDEWQNRACGHDITEILDPDKDIRPLAEKCLEYGAGAVLIKSGAPGMYYMTGNQDRMQPVLDRLSVNAADWVNKSGFERSYVPEAVISGTGAGDTSIAAFLTSMLNGESLEECLHLATATGACCVAAVDALGGLKSLEELKDKISRGWEKNK